MSKRFGFWPHITHFIVLTFKEIKHLSDYRTVGLSDYRSDPDTVTVHMNPELVFRRELVLANCREDVTVEKVLSFPIGPIPT